MNQESNPEDKSIPFDAVAKPLDLSTKGLMVPGAEKMQFVESELETSGVTKLDVGRMPAMIDYVNQEYELPEDWQHKAAHKDSIKKNAFDPADQKRIELEKKYEEMRSEKKD